LRANASFFQDAAHQILFGQSWWEAPLHHALLPPAYRGVLVMNLSSSSSSLVYSEPVTNQLSDDDMPVIEFQLALGGLNNFGRA
jgi:hypothetical protein